MLCCAEKKKLKRVSSIIAEDEQPVEKDVTILEKISGTNFPVYLVNSKKYGSKLVMKAYLSTPNQISSYYKREVKAADLNHQNVIKIIDLQPWNIIKEYHGKPTKLNMSYVLMEYAPYGDVCTLIKENRFPKDEKLVRTYFHQIIEGLAHIHSKGLIHMDMKLANLLIGDGYQIKIADFDLAQSQDEISTAGNGTEDYRAPEIIDGSAPRTTAADIYSTAIILFAMKFHFLPYSEATPSRKGYNLFDMLKQEDKEYWDALSRIVGKPLEVSEEFKELFSMMTKYDPAERATIEEIKKSKWYKGPKYSPDKLRYIMKHQIGSSHPIRKITHWLAKLR